jgi:hypothetical protein
MDLAALAKAEQQAADAVAIALKNGSSSALQAARLNM